jgi:hypothetical protein
MDAANAAFLQTFGLYFEYDQMFYVTALNERAGCPRSPLECHFDYCGDDDCMRDHHKSSSHFVHVNEANAIPGIDRVIRFVNFRLCYYCPVRDYHGWVLGLARNLMGDAIVSTATTPFQVQVTTVHELSHTLGVEGHICTPGQICVMHLTNYNYNVWCERHVSDILNHIDGL